MAERHGPLHISWRPHCSQADFDQVLWASDLNVVRGEDSLVRALWAGKPLIWHIYPQDDGAHHAKLAAFLDWIEAPASMRLEHMVWNADGPSPLAADDPISPAADWAPAVTAARRRLLAQTDLLSQLVAHITGH
jgi:uncharacterized repeat protein (TIGR03837 family)